MTFTQLKRPTTQQLHVKMEIKHHKRSKNLQFSELLQLDGSLLQH